MTGILPTRRRWPAAVAAIAGLALACGGGGGGGGGPVGPDVTPPPIPVSSLISVDPPIPVALVRLSGEAGAVEANAVVRLANASATQRTGQPVTASAQASSQGAFSLSVTAQLGDQLQLTASDAAGNTSGVLALQAGPTPLNLNLTQPGGNDLLTLGSGQGAFNLAFPNGNERYVIVAQSLNPGSESFPLTVSGSVAARVRGLAPARRAETPAGLEGELRAAERQAVATLPRPGPRGRRLGLSDDPAVGSIDTFNVVNRTSGATLTNRAHFDEVTARLRYKGAHTLIYVDTRAEGANVSDALIEQVGDRFDDHTYGIDRAAFGEESDVDGNGRVIILLTPVVNALNTQQTVDEGGLLTGFFFGIDLLFHPTLNPFSNDAEIFYTVVPDPTKQFGPAVVQVDGFDQQLDGVLAHEFEHMINAGIRIDRDAALETVWLDEGLAHFAETLAGVTFDGQTDLQNSLRSALWLQEPHAQSLVGGDDTLERRGAAWLLVAYLVDRHGQGILRDLVRGPFTGIPNVEQHADTSFPFLFFRWTAALLLDGQGISSDPAFDIPGLDVRERFQAAKAWWAGTSRLPGPYLGLRISNVPGSLGSTGIALAGSSPAYFEVRATTPGTVPVIVSAAQTSNLQVTIIRTQ